MTTREAQNDLIDFIHENVCNFSLSKPFTRKTIAKPAEELQVASSVSNSRLRFSACARDWRQNNKWRESINQVEKRHHTTVKVPRNSKYWETARRGLQSRSARRKGLVILKVCNPTPL